MSQKYDNRNRGLLYPNQKKTSDNAPSMRGHVDIDGVEYELSGWTIVPKTGKIAGQKCLSISIQKKGSYQKGSGGNSTASPHTSQSPPPQQQAPAQGCDEQPPEEENVPF